MLNWFKKGKNKPAASFSNEEWVERLQPPPDDYALQELRKILVRGLKAALSKRVDRQLDELAEDHAQNTLMKILEHVDTFRGDSKFTTWAMKIAIREALADLRRKHWGDVQMSDLLEREERHSDTHPSLSDDSNDPESETSVRMITETVNKLIEEELTARQREAIMAIMFHQMPPDVVAEQMDTNRNALYKLVHDARVKLKKALKERGMSPEDILEQL